MPFALGEEAPYRSLVESKESSYYNLVMPYFFESDLSSDFFRSDFESVRGLAAGA